jgi:hypothetical protein
MPTDPEPDFAQVSDAELFELLREALSAESDVPDSVIEAAVAIHDWVDVDEELAALSDGFAAVRSATVPMVWTAGGGSIELHSEAAGWRRQRLEVSVIAPDETPPARIRVELQSASGERVAMAPQTELSAQNGGFGEAEFALEIPVGLWRIRVSAAGWSLLTEWFRI